ncbi:MAG: DNA-binding protein WhiA [Lachnospiraceae bacterium]|nr:DNA-binding protein WhiA [Lachnospiraceae bacterium]
MSFSGNVKEELTGRVGRERHCQIAEVAAITMLACEVHETKHGKYFIKLYTENARIARKYFTLLKKAFNITAGVMVRRRKTGRTAQSYLLWVQDSEEVRRVLMAVKVISPDVQATLTMFPENRLIIQKECCKRAFLRGAFLSVGSVSDPDKSYHFELVLDTPAWSRFFKELICDFGPDARIVKRGKHFVVYVKEAEGISELLNLMEAHVSMMEFENVRILKEIGNVVNRRVNCETANLQKTVSSAVKQTEDIRLIEDTVGLDSLSPALAEAARARLKYPDLALAELGKQMNPPVGKSGMNHRLRKLAELAEDLRAHGAVR